MKKIITTLLVTTLLSCNSTKTDQTNISDTTITQDGVTVGDKWLYTSCDPFSPRIDTNFVLYIKDGWVKYKTDGGYVNTTPITLFKTCSKKIK